MKKILSIVFVALFLLNSFGYYFIFSLNQKICKEEMRCLVRAGYFKDHFEKIVISDPASNKELKWIDKDEFRYRGHLYDLVSTEIKGATAILYCINDQKEEKLIAGHQQIRDLFAGLFTPEKVKNTLALQHLLIKQALIKTLTIRPPESSGALSFAEPTFELASVVLTPASPPPRCA